MLCTSRPSTNEVQTRLTVGKEHTGPVNSLPQSAGTNGEALAAEKVGIKMRSDLKQMDNNRAPNLPVLSGRQTLPAKNICAKKAQLDVKQMGNNRGAKTPGSPPPRGAVQPFLTDNARTKPNSFSVCTQKPSQFRPLTQKTSQLTSTP